MIARAVWKDVGERSVRVASVEDLVFMKLISERPKDRDDGMRLLRRHKKIIDRQYLRPKLEEMAEALASPDILEIYEAIVEGR